MRHAALALSLLLLAGTAQAKDIAGVTIPDTLDAAGKTLKLNGAGVRTRFFIKVYAAGLYLEEESKNAQQIIDADRPKAVVLKLLRDLDRKTMQGAIREGVENNSKEQLPALKERLDTLLEQIPALKKNDEFTVTYVPGQGTRVNDGAPIEGKDFADAIFKIWLGQKPADADLKKGLLGF